MAEPFTIKIYVPDGDPESVRIIDRMNWTGRGVVFPREKWPEIRSRNEFSQPGVYILIGYTDDEDDLPTLYIGEGVGIGTRIKAHYKNKQFWDWAIGFVSTNHGLNKAHVIWLEWALIQQAYLADRSSVENARNPVEPPLAESEKADIKAFLKEIYQILPLAGLRAFEVPEESASSHNSTKTDKKKSETDWDTVIVPAKHDGFLKAYLGENAWWAVRISEYMKTQLKWCAAYQTAPRSAITHIAEIEKIVPIGEVGKSKIIFKGPALELKEPIEFGNAPSGSMQGMRYVNKQVFDKARTLSDLFVDKH